MKTAIKKIEPVFRLYGSSYNGCYEKIELFVDDLRNADIGTKWISSGGCCGRGLREESLEIIYKNAEGCAVLRRIWGTTDSPDPEFWENDPELIWVEYGKYYSE